jgi:hypothetical protein
MVMDCRRRVETPLSGLLNVKPGFLCTLAAHYGLWRDLEGIGRFLYVEPAEISQFHDFGLARVEFREIRQGIIQRHHQCQPFA